MATETVNIGESFNSLCTSIRFGALVTALAMIVGGIILLAAAGIIYFKKVKGQERKPVWVAAGVISLGLGVILLLSGIIGLITYFLAPPSQYC